MHLFAYDAAGKDQIGVFHKINQTNYPDLDIDGQNDDKLIITATVGLNNAIGNQGTFVLLDDNFQVLDFEIVNSANLAGKAVSLEADGIGAGPYYIGLIAQVHNPKQTVWHSTAFVKNWKLTLQDQIETTEAYVDNNVFNYQPTYRYGFNGKEREDEWSGTGNIYDYGFRIYNPRLGKFLSVDPLTSSYPWYTPYQFAGNKPIWAVDLDGLEELIFQESALDFEIGINQIVLADEYLSDQYAKVQSDERHNIKVYITAEPIIGQYREANGTHVDVTSTVHFYKQANAFFEKTGRSVESLTDDQKAVYLKSAAVVGKLGLNNEDINFDNEYHLVTLNTSFLRAVPVGGEISRISWEYLLPDIVTTFFHEVLAHVVNPSESAYSEHDYIYSIEENQDYYTEEEVKAFKNDSASPSDDRAHPDSIMGKIVAGTKRAVDALKNKITDGQ